jgi:hypothetical protein
VDVFGCLQVVITSALIGGKLLLIGSHKKTQVNLQRGYYAIGIYLHDTSNVLELHMKKKVFNKVYNNNNNNNLAFCPKQVGVG